MEKNVKKVCKCENCGNESEMTVTCALPEEAHSHDKGKGENSKSVKVKGTATCTHCGNEADMWIDM